MVSVAIIHVIGTLTLLLLVVFVLMHTAITNQNLIVKNERMNLQRISYSIAYQLLYLFAIRTNTSIEPNYPVTVLYGKEYNIIIASGEKIKSIYSFVSDLNDTYIYVFLIDPSNNVYAYTLLYKNNSEEPLYIVKDQSIHSCSNNNMILFSSNSIVLIKKILLDNVIILSCELRGVKGA
jgi:hypothetical protein